MRAEQEIRDKLHGTTEFIDARDGEDYPSTSTNYLVLEVAKQREYILKWVLGEMDD